MKTKSEIKLGSSDRVFYAVTYSLMFLALILVILPIANVIACSISDPNQVMQGKIMFLPKGLTFAAYRAVLADNKIVTGYANTIFYTAVTTLFGVCVTVMCAYPLSRKDLKGRDFLMMMVTFTMLFSGGIIPNYLLIRDLGLIDNRWALILPGLINAYDIIVARTFFQSTIPDDLLEAAKIDGCTNLRFIWTIVLPLSKAIMAVLALYFIVANWNAWFSAYLYMNDAGKYPLQLVLKEILLANSTPAGEAGAVADASGFRMDALSEVMKYASILIACVPIWCIYPFLQKYFVKGVMIGAIKG